MTTPPKSILTFIPAQPSSVLNDDAAASQHPEIPADRHYTIREITAETVDDVLPVFLMYHKFYKCNDHSVEEARAFLHKRLSTGTSRVWCVFDHHNTAVAFTQIYFRYSSLGLEDNWVLNDLFVAKSQRSHGLGSKIIKFVLKWAEESGAFKVYIETTINNQPTQSLYPHLGFVEYARYDDTIDYVYKFERAKQKQYPSYFEPFDADC